MKSISLIEMEDIFKLILEKLKKEGHVNIEVEQDFYKYIPCDIWDSFENDAIEYGSLFDDIDELKKMTNLKDRPCTYVDFDRLSSLLRAISQKNNPI